MVQRIKPSKIKIVPRDGELEITLNINISVDGIVTATALADGAPADVKVEDDDSVEFEIPDFGSDVKLDFGKKV